MPSAQKRKRAPSGDVVYRDFHRSKIERAIMILDGTVVKVGVQGKSAFQRKDVRVMPKRGRTKGRRTTRILRGTGKLRVVDIATIHEFGSPKAKIPERSFLRSAIRDHKPRLLARMRKAWRSALREGDAERDLRRLALLAESVVKNRIVELSDPPLASSTKRRRRAMTGDEDPNPLIDTGQLKNSITAAIEGRFQRGSPSRGRR